MTTSTKVSELKINKLTEAQYSSITPSDTELYFLTDGGGDIPSQTGNAGKFLGTDGTDTSWEEVESVSLEAGNGIVIDEDIISTDKRIPALATSGTISLEDNSSKSINVGGNVTFELPGAMTIGTPFQVGSSAWQGITYGNNKFVAVGSSGYITTSTDGTTWDTPFQVGSSTWIGVTYGNNKFVAVGSSGYISTSTDGTTWDTPFQVGSSAWRGITYANNKFVVVGDSGYVSTSTDGSTWTTPVQINASVDWYAITYGNNKFVAVGHGGRMSTSTDGTTWGSLFVVGNSTWYGITYGNNKFVAVGGSGYISTSTDGSTWDTPFLVGTNSWYGITYANNKFVIANNAGYISTSTNGSTWATPFQVVSSGGWYEITYANNKFVLVGSSGYMVTITIPDSSTFDTTSFHQIFVQLHMDTAYSVDLGTSHWLTKDAPNLSQAGDYNIYYEYDKEDECWRVGALNKKGA